MTLLPDEQPELDLDLNPDELEIDESVADLDELDEQGEYVEPTDGKQDSI
jgi:hypothetical protein